MDVLPAHLNRDSFRDFFKGSVALEIISDLPFGFPINNIISLAPSPRALVRSMSNEKISLVLGFQGLRNLPPLATKAKQLEHLLVEKKKKKPEGEGPAPKNVEDPLVFLAFEKY